MGNANIRFDFGSGSDILKIYVGDTIQVTTLEHLKNIWSDEEVYKWMLFKPTLTEIEAIDRTNRLFPSPRIALNQSYFAQWYKWIPKPFNLFNLNLACFN